MPKTLKPGLADSTCNRPNLPPVAGRGAGPCSARLHPLVRNGPGRTEQSVLSSLTIRWLVTHESTESIGMSDRRRSRLLHLVGGALSPDLLLSRDSDGIHTHPRGKEASASSPRNHARVSGTLHRTVSQSQFHRCEPAEVARVRKKQRTLTDRKSVWTRPPRRETLRPESQTQVSPPSRPSRLHGRGGPIGVVKLLRARGGCLGVIRIRAWKAAKSPGELPNERRARNARGDPGN